MLSLIEFELELEQDIFNSLLKDGAMKLARKINRLESYKIYDSKYPNDKYAPILSLDVVIENFGPPPDETDGPHAMAASDHLVALYYASLTPRQKQIITMEADGYTQPEIAAELGYQGTGVIRYQKHLAKKKWEALQ